MVVTGEELVELPKVTWRWVVNDYETRVENRIPGVAEESPVYWSCGYEMKICLYPSGHSATSTETVGLFFDVRGGQDEGCAQFKGELALLDPSDMSRKHVAQHKHRHPVPSRHGWAKFCPKAKLLAVTAQTDRLAIEATVTFFENPRSANRWLPRPTLGNDLGRLRRDMDYADVVFTVRDRSFKAHRCVLAARASSLAALAADGNAVPLPDFIDADVFEKCLDFVYTDAIDEDDLDERPEAFLRCANFCGAVRLKQLAELRLADRLSPASAARNLLLADALDCAHLLEVARDCIVENLPVVVKHDDWAKLKQAPHLLAHILEAAAVDARAASFFPTSPNPKRRRVNDLRLQCEVLNLETDGSKQVLERRLALSTTTASLGSTEDDETSSRSAL